MAVEETLIDDFLLQTISEFDTKSLSAPTLRRLGSEKPERFAAQAP
jgi:hypothetical protein